MDKVSNVVLDIDLTQPTELCCTGSPKMTVSGKVLSRKGSIRMDKHNGEEQKADDASKKLVIKDVLFLGTMSRSSIGTMILIYFTLAINRKNGAYLRS
ncbi:hypothetical protein B296_00032563 [Ensete ventricosum]|uniref:Uncharacterized protein n=1 Tax=Ensete ventricosum TaxID=4639 RepID=A0A427A7F6_ENSVE|nr:hypothetical protein B296_00032563 [Ensete ventricosum]